MRIIRNAGLGLALLSVAGLAVPAEAQHRHRWGHHDGNGSDVLVGALVAGGVLAIAASALRSHPKDDYVAEDDSPPPPDDFESEPLPPPPVGEPGAAALSEDDAADTCAQAAESQGTEAARIAHVSDIASVDPAGSGGWYVQGTIELRQSYRDQEPRHERFRCTVGASGTPNVRIEGVAPAETPAETDDASAES